MHSDASLIAWGGCLPEEGWCRDHPSKCGHRWVARGAWPVRMESLLELLPLTKEEKENVSLESWTGAWLIQLFELLAVWFSMVSFKTRKEGRVLTPRIDNTTALAYVRNGGGREPVKAAVARKIALFAAEIGVTIWAPEYIRSEDNLADRASRVVDPSDWKVRRWVFQHCEKRWGPHTVDRFADSDNALLQRFNARWLCPGAEATDAFTQDWRGENNWAVPPFGVIFRALRLIIETKAQASILVPLWEGQVWWPLLRKIWVDAWEIPGGGRGFVRGPSGHVEPWVNPVWRFLVVRVDGGRDGQRPVTR